MVVKTRPERNYVPLYPLLHGSCRSDVCPVQNAGKPPAAKKYTVPYKQEEGGWTRVRVIPDSGAIESVAPPDMAPQFAVRPSAGSQRGQQYVTASGDEIPNEGEQVVPAMSRDGNMLPHRWQIADVTRPLQSVGELCDQGNRVTFGRGGGVIQNLAIGETSSLSRENGTYILDLWIPPAAGFPRQGW